MLQFAVAALGQLEFSTSSELRDGRWGGSNSKTVRFPDLRFSRKEWGNSPFVLLLVFFFTFRD